MNAVKPGEGMHERKRKTFFGDGTVDREAAAQWERNRGEGPQERQNRLELEEFKRQERMLAALRRSNRGLGDLISDASTVVTQDRGHARVIGTETTSTRSRRPHRFVNALAVILMTFWVVLLGRSSLDWVRRLLSI